MAWWLWVLIGWLSVATPAALVVGRFIRVGQAGRGWAEVPNRLQGSAADGQRQGAMAEAA